MTFDQWCAQYDVTLRRWWLVAWKWEPIPERQGEMHAPEVKGEDE